MQTNAAFGLVRLARKPVRCVLKPDYTADNYVVNQPKSPRNSSNTAKRSLTFFAMLGPVRMLRSPVSIGRGHRSGGYHLSVRFPARSISTTFWWPSFTSSEAPSKNITLYFTGDPRSVVLMHQPRAGRNRVSTAYGLGSVAN